MDYVYSLIRLPEDKIYLVKDKPYACKVIMALPMPAQILSRPLIDMFFASLTFMNC